MTPVAYIVAVLGNIDQTPVRQFRVVVDGVARVVWASEATEAMRMFPESAVIGTVTDLTPKRTR